VHISSHSLCLTSLHEHSRDPFSFCWNFGAQAVQMGKCAPEKASPAHVAKIFAKYQAQNQIPSLFEKLATKVREKKT
jgi:hypothetical protein